MVQVVMLISMAAANWSLVPGDVTEVTEEVANEWVNNGIAKLYEPPEVKTIERPEPPKEGQEEELTVDQSDGEKNEDPQPEDPQDESSEGIKHVGGGWYLLPNGEKVQGKDEALAELAKLGDE